MADPLPVDELDETELELPPPEETVVVVVVPSEEVVVLVELDEEPLPFVLPFVLLELAEPDAVFALLVVSSPAGVQALAAPAAASIVTE